jgi:hypothetical protein
MSDCLWVQTSGGGWRKDRVKGQIWSKYFISMYKIEQWNPPRIVFKRWEVENEEQWRGWICSKHIICMNGNITMKNLCIVNIF